MEAWACYVGIGDAKEAGDVTAQASLRESHQTRTPAQASSAGSLSQQYFHSPLSPTTPLSFLNMRSPVLAFSLFAVAATVSASPMPQLQQEESPILHSSVPTSQEASRLTPRWEDASRARTPGSFGNQDASSMGTPQIAGVLPSSGELLGPSFFSLRRPNGV